MMPSMTDKIFDWALHNLVDPDREPSFEQFSQSIGTKAFTVADLDVARSQLVRADSTMSQDWLGDYVACGFHNIDPFLRGVWRGQSLMTVDSGTLVRNDDTCSASYALNHGLSDAGYGHLRASTFHSAAEGGTRLVSLCFADDDHDVDPSAALAFSSVINTFYRFGEEKDPLTFWRTPQVRITKRERDALSFLADGNAVSTVAFKMGISETMVHRHLSSCQSKYGAASREQLIAMAIKDRVIGN